MNVGLADFVRMAESVKSPVPRFKCGHPKTPENTRKNNKYERCKRCHQEMNRMYHINKQGRA